MDSREELSLMKEWVAAELTAWKSDHSICPEPGAKENVARLRHEVTEKLGIKLAERKEVVA
jgi:hypothetical protein